MKWKLFRRRRRTNPPMEGVRRASRWPAEFATLWAPSLPLVRDPEASALAYKKASEVLRESKLMPYLMVEEPYPSPEDAKRPDEEGVSHEVEVLPPTEPGS